MRSLLTTALTALVVLLSLVAAGCGDDEADVAVEVDAPAAVEAPDGPAVSYSVAEITDALDGGGLEVVRDPQAPAAGDIDPEPLEAVQFADRTGVEFTVLFFESAAEAQRAIPTIRDAAALEDGGAIATAYNTVAIVPDQEEAGVSRRVLHVFRELRTLGARTITVEELIDRHELLLGETVTISGDVIQRLPNDSARPRAITIRGPGGGEILVVPAEGERWSLDEAEALTVTDGPLTVTGQLTIVGLAGGLDATPDNVLTYRTGDPVIIADSLSVDAAEGAGVGDGSDAADGG